MLFINAPMMAGSPYLHMVPGLQLSNITAQNRVDGHGSFTSPSHTRFVSCVVHCIRLVLCTAFDCKLSRAGFVSGTCILGSAGRSARRRAQYFPQQPSLHAWLCRRELRFLFPPSVVHSNTQNIVHAHTHTATSLSLSHTHVNIEEYLKTAKTSNRW
jgi:hypothetical protein